MISLVYVQKLLLLTRQRRSVLFILLARSPSFPFEARLKVDVSNCFPTRRF